MGNQCKGTEENNQKIFQSSQALIDFVYRTITMFLDLKQYQQDQKELQQLLNFVKSINLNQQTQVLENDHFISLQKISSRKKQSQKKFCDQVNELGSVNLQESLLILNQYNLCILQFQDLYNSINTLEQHKVDQLQVLKNKQISESNNKEIISEKHLYQMFIRISHKKFIIFQIIDHWITKIQSKNLKLIIRLASIIIIEIYSSIKEIIIPDRIFQILIMWMVQVIVFNLCNSTVQIKKYEHLLDFIFYYKCPIEKMMILLAQQKVLRIQYVMRDQDEIADCIHKLLQQYPHASLLKHEIKLIEYYVDENWFISLYHIVRTWSVIAQRF